MYTSMFMYMLMRMCMCMCMCMGMGMGMGMPMARHGHVSRQGAYPYLVSCGEIQLLQRNLRNN